MPARFAALSILGPVMHRHNQAIEFRREPLTVRDISRHVVSVFLARPERLAECVYDDKGGRLPGPLDCLPDSLSQARSVGGRILHIDRRGDQREGNCSLNAMPLTERYKAIAQACASLSAHIDHKTLPDPPGSPFPAQCHV